MDIPTASALAKALPDPITKFYDAFDYLQVLNKLLQDYLEKFGSDTDALQALKTDVILPLDRDQIVMPRLISVLNRSRGGTKIDLNVVRSILKVYALLGRTSYDFEKEYTEGAVTHYEAELTVLHNDSGIHKRLLFVEDVLKSEKELSENINLPAELLKNVEQKLIKALLRDLPSEQLKSLIPQKEYDTLKLFFQLWEKVGDIDPVTKVWRYDTWHRVKGVLKNEECTMEEYLDMKRDYEYIIKECFESHEEFVRVFLDAVTSQGSSTLPYVCVKYADKNLKENIANRQSKEELDSWMNDVLELTPHFDREKWSTVYYNYFVRRVLAYGTLAMDVERLMMSKIPYLQVDNLLKYVGDEMVEIQQKFKEYLVKEKIKLSLELDIKLLYGSWSILSKGVRLNYPPQLQQVQDTFGTFFKQFQTSTPGAKTLHWTYPQAGTCTVVGNFASGSKQLFVTVQQAIVLLLFNDDETLSFEEISEKTAIKEGALKSVLLPIVRSGMLVKHSSANFISEDDAFSFGANFSSIHSEFDFSFNAAPVTRAGLNNDGKLQLQAAIVRVIKYHRTMTWRNLVSETFAAVGARLKISKRHVNETIAILIEREYIQRSQTERDKLEYIV